MTDEIEICEAERPDGRCTLAKDHDGPHVTMVRGVLANWHDKSSAKRAFDKSIEVLRGRKV